MRSTDIPQLHPHLRFQWEPAQDAYVLLYPEGMVKLNGSAGEILAVCDGERSVADIIAVLEKKFPKTPDIGADIIEFLTTARANQWLVSD
jgi:pyrroloquinoline quinone biosynthesis protein D